MSFIKVALRIVILFLIVLAVSGIIGGIYHIVSSLPIFYCEYMTGLIISVILMIFGIFAMLRGYHPGKNSMDTETDYYPRWGVRNPTRMLFVGTLTLVMGLVMFFVALYFESLLH